MPLRKSKDKELQPAHAEHANDSPLHSEGENDPITFLPMSPLVERSYENLVFKEKEADREGDFAKSSNMFRGQRQHQLMEAATPVADHGHQPQHKYILLARKGNVGPRHQPCPRDFFQPQVPPAQPEQRGLQNQPTQFFNRDHGLALRPLEKIDKDMLRFPNKAKETMEVDADPFPAMSVGVSVAELRSVVRNHSLPYAQRNLAAEDLRWVLEAKRSRHSRSVRSPSRRWEKVSHPKFPAQNPRTLRRRLQRKRAEERKRHQKQVEAEGSSSRRPHQPTKRNMIWVRKEKKEAVTQTLQKKDDQSSASPKVASVIVSPDGVLKATFEAQEQSGNHGAESKEDGTIHFGEFSVNLSCLVLTLPLIFQAKKEEEPIVCEFPEQTEEEVIVVPAQDDEEEDMADKIVFEKPEEKMARHIRPLYIKAHMDGTPISRVLVDNGAAINVLPTCMLYKIGKSLADLVHTEVTISDFTGGVNHSRGVLPVELTVGNRTPMSAFFVVDTVATYNALLGCDWIHSSRCVPSSFHQKLIFWNGGKAEVVSADDKPFSANTHLVEARYYEEDIVLKQLSGEYKCTSLALAPYFALAVQLLEEFDDVSIRHVPRDRNYEANEMAQIASGLRIPEGVMQKVIIVEKRSLPSIHQRGMTISTCSIDATQTDWRFPIIQYFKDQSTKVSRKTKMQALNYVLIEDVLYRRGHNELLLRCLGPDESFQMLSDVHDGICGAHQAGIKMRWLIRRHGFFWPSVLKDCIAYAKSCKSCQIHGPLQRVPASELNSIVKPWPFRGWAIDLIGKVYPPSSKGHSFIIVATNYFIKWVEAKPMKKVDQSDVIKFIKEDIIHRFGLPETITTDQGTVFVNHQVEAFVKEMGFRLLNSTPYYAQANGQAEASNKVVINLLEKMVDDNPRRWHELLSETLWAYRTSQRSSTKMTPFALTYGHDAVLPMELTARSLRVLIQHNLQYGEYDEAMMLELEDLEDSRLTALDRLQAQKLKIAKSYNKRVKSKNLAVGDLVWKAILPLGKKDHRFGKWSPNWEGPFLIHEVLRRGDYWLESLDGELHLRKINGIYLKPYYPTVWEARGLESQEAV
ncbi:hypothetical protein SLEP1_g44699 [Rubroshorea leprosula]|uniref:Integrase catalytic domain-containing protein n=1 Tax=Rubroshorea leprosula TaxID=152421 RepID=A0AAV5LHC3_9ROSI|nr:hypothetical protein SLEP1_g44699 [Rubroshorea leprosula]